MITDMKFWIAKTLVEIGLSLVAVAAVFCVLIFVAWRDERKAKERKAKERAK